MRRISSMAAALIVGLAWLAAGAPAAWAAPIGGLLIIPGSGTDLDEIRVRTSAGCPPPTTAYYATTRGHGLPPDGQVVTANTAAGLSHESGFDAYFLLVMRDYALDNHTTLSGRYDVTVYCVERLTLRSYGEFTGSLEFTSPTTFEAIGAAKPTGDAPPPVELDLDGSLIDPSLPPAGPPVGAAGEGSAPNAAVPASPGTDPQAPVGAGRELSSDSASRPGPGWSEFVLVAVIVSLTAVTVATVLRRRRAR